MTVQEFYMNEALIEARKAQKMNEVPIGAVIVRYGKIIGRGHNTRETEKSPLAHAEITAIKNASQMLQGWRLTDCDIYVTLEPCLMCAGAIYQARIVNLFYGATDYKAGAVESIFKVLEEPKLNHHVHVESGLMEKECRQTISNFFKYLRQMKKDRKLAEQV
ncbi:nucleoside deaminase [Acidaminobacter sp. JC074]|uniref:tRNA adenosine(34) deaminase TadA n=1 Tax=Acidaminobacter sp. JC074 TaxID=2530199 RepID=UPI001F0F7F7A|nr:tRNA adenosine(34) deaminase TadA [Acidaminobacter sp. JC074]MCH4891088.1 nucleoside deaminase [Acidaminobacter sp. JC074]